jgi:hypothetical protein
MELGSAFVANAGTRVQALFEQPYPALIEIPLSARCLSESQRNALFGHHYVAIHRGGAHPEGAGGLLS